MTHGEKKRWLGRYRDTRKEVAELTEKRARAKSFGEKVTVGAGGMPGSGRADKVALSVERVAQIDEELRRLRQLLPELERETEDALLAVKNPEYRRVMRYYYVECLTWAEVAALAGYSLRYVRKLNDALVEQMV